MRINTRFTVAVHILALIELNEGKPVGSEMMALSVGTNPVVIRQIMSALKKAGIIQTQSGIPGGKLAKTAENISLFEVYQAVKRKKDASLFDFHSKPNPICPIGCNIKSAMEQPLFDAQEAMEDTLKKYFLRDVTNSILEKVNLEQAH